MQLFWSWPRSRTDIAFLILLTPKHMAIDIQSSSGTAQMATKSFGRGLALLRMALATLAITASFLAPLKGQSCNPPAVNAIVCENSQPGTPGWEVGGSG